MSEAQPQLIVAIGASAGGLQPLKDLLGPMPREPQMAFIVVTHLNRKGSSMLPEILERETWMPVQAATDGQRVEPGHIYVLAPNNVLTIEGGCLRVYEPAPDQPAERNPIDIFFSALARDQGAFAVGVVLSGSGSDGALGLKAIKEHGGITLAQGVNHSSPSHSSMPASAIATGMVDMIVPVEDIPARLVELAQTVSKTVAPEDLDDHRHPQLHEVKQAICDIVQQQVGHDFSGYKASTFLRRVRRRQNILRLSDLETYVQQLRDDPDEVTALFRDLLIHVTSFFRDLDAFRALSDQLPEVMKGKEPGEPLRIWIPGCSTGEEVYSIAILVHEHLRQLERPPEVQIFATDIDAAALSVARSGRYPAALLEAVPSEWLERYFAREGVAAYRVIKELRTLCVFSAHSLVKDPPFSRIDLISCRNLLIYLTADLQGRVFPLFHYALRPGGFLFLGSAENIGHSAELFHVVDGEHRIFQRNDDTPSTVPFPVYRAGGHRPTVATAAPAHAKPSQEAVRRMADTLVLERYAPAFVVIDDTGDVLHYSGRTGKYLESPTGAPTRQLIFLARKDFRAELSSALFDVRQTRRTVKYPGLHVRLDGRAQAFDLTVERLSTETEGQLFLVLFEDAGEPVDAAATDTDAAASLSNAEGEWATRLQAELQTTKERLQAVIEEYETALEELRSSNEELVSMNEEMQSTTEELETAKEEQQSVNEELQTVNRELRSKIDDLARATDDMRNLFASTPIATVFLDRQLMIRSFTPDATGIFHLIETDVGRRLTDIAHRLYYPELQNDLDRVIRSGESTERQVATKAPDARPLEHFLARIWPYRAESGVIEGVLATFVDVTRLVEAETHQRLLVAELNHRVRNMLAIVLGLAAQTGRPGITVDEFLETFQGRLQAMARTFELLSREQWSSIELREVLQTAIAPFVSRDHQIMRMEGPWVLLRPKAALALGMVLHELVTNAVKYGALSDPDGHISVTWSVTSTQDAHRVEIEWAEHNGPECRDAVPTGFGTRLIAGEMKQTLQGDSKMEFARDGLRVHLEFPAGANIFPLDAEHPDAPENVFPFSDALPGREAT